MNCLKSKRYEEDRDRGFRRGVVRLGVLRMHAPRGSGDRNHPAAAGAGYGDDSRLGIEGVIEKPASNLSRRA